MNEKKIKVYAQVGDDLLFDVFVTVSQEAWDEELDSLEEAVRVMTMRTSSKTLLMSHIMVAISVQLMAVAMAILLHTDV